MTQPQNQQDKEPEGLTREFNFPKPWIRDYNPQIHGIKPGMETPQPSTPPLGGQPPSSQAGQQLPQYPVAPPNHPPGNTPQGGPVQWNATGVYGGQAEKQKGLPTWAWTLISAIILIIVLLVLFFVILK